MQVAFAGRKFFDAFFLLLGDILLALLYHAGTEGVGHVGNGGVLPAGAGRVVLGLSRFADGQLHALLCMVPKIVQQFGAGLYESRVHLWQFAGGLQVGLAGENVLGEVGQDHGALISVLPATGEVGPVVPSGLHQSVGSGGEHIAVVGLLTPDFGVVFGPDGLLPVVCHQVLPLLHVLHCLAQTTCAGRRTFLSRFLFSSFSHGSSFAFAISHGSSFAFAFSHGSSFAFAFPVEALWSFFAFAFPVEALWSSFAPPFFVPALLSCLLSPLSLGLSSSDLADGGTLLELAGFLRTGSH